jgi:hypothetical protein
MTAVRSVVQKIRWPPAGLGLGAPANLALLAADGRHNFTAIAFAAISLGSATALILLGLDQLLFGGVSLSRVRAVAEFSFTQRLLIVIFSAATEELIYRLGVATGVAALALLALRNITPNAARISMWSGVLVAAVLFGLAHVGNLPNVPHPYLRAITLNGIAGLVLGWLYWFRGLEAAVLGHFAGDVTIYFVVAGLL